MLNSHCNYLNVGRNQRFPISLINFLSKFIAHVTSSEASIHIHSNLQMSFRIINYIISIISINFGHKIFSKTNGRSNIMEGINISRCELEINFMHQN